MVAQVYDCHLYINAMCMDNVVIVFLFMESFVPAAAIIMVGLIAF